MNNIFDSFDPSKKPILLSAGGTGGHLFPAEALAQELLSRGRRIVIVTDKRGHAFKSLGDGVPVHTVRAATLKPGIAAKASAVIDMGIGILQAMKLLFKYRPAVIVGFGGYPSFPAVFAGQCLGIPTVLHEQNAVLGKANLFLAARAKAIAASLPDTRGITPANKNKVAVTGNPVRPAIVAVRNAAYRPPVDNLKILVTGGSQAASIFGEIIPKAAALLPEEAKRRLYIMHQSRESDLAATEEKYRQAGVAADVKTFFSDMPERLSACHLFIGRSGASTVAEIAVTGRPAVFVPLRHADMQQKHNAEALTGTGGGWLVMQEDFTPETLAQKLQEFMANPAMLEKAASAAKACGRTDAASRLADVVEQKMA